jgi:hypothetical protein
MRLWTEAGRKAAQALIGPPMPLRFVRRTDRPAELRPVTAATFGPKSDAVTAPAVALNAGGDGATVGPLRWRNVVTERC